MRCERVQIKSRGREFKIEAVKLSPLGKVSGLMFGSLKKAKPLLFEFSRSCRGRIHSFFVFFSFLAVWLDGSNNVVDYKVVKPFRFNLSSRNPCKKLLEVPLKKDYKNFWEKFVGEKDLNNTYSSRH